MMQNKDDARREKKELKHDSIEKPVDTKNDPTLPIMKLLEYSEPGLPISFKIKKMEVKSNEGIVIIPSDDGSEIILHIDKNLSDDNLIVAFDKSCEWQDESSDTFIEYRSNFG